MSTDNEEKRWARSSYWDSFGEWETLSEREKMSIEAGKGLPGPSEQLELFDETTFDDYDFTFNWYQDEAVSTLGPDSDPRTLALGVGGEAGEVMEIIINALYMTKHVTSIQEVVKKGHRPGKVVDVEHLEEEIGDVLWYLATLADYYNLDLEVIAINNITKLKERYGS